MINDIPVTSSLPTCQSCLNTLLLQEAEPAGDSSEVGALWQDIEEGLREQAARLHSDLALSHQENRELRERLMVSEATVHAQAEQLKDYRDLLSESLSGTCMKECRHVIGHIRIIKCSRKDSSNSFLLSLQQRHRSSRPVSRCRLISRIWVMRLVVAVRTKLREKTPAAQVTNRPDLCKNKLKNAL